MFQYRLVLRQRNNGVSISRLKKGGNQRCNDGSKLLSSWTASKFHIVANASTTTTTRQRKAVEGRHLQPYSRSDARGRRLQKRLFVTKETTSGALLKSSPERSEKTNRILAQEEDQQDPYQQALAALPKGGQIHLDFFGEPVTFFNFTGKDISNVVAALDVFEIGIATKGKAFTGGGEEDGLNVQAAHSAAMAWSELLRHASILNNQQPSYGLDDNDDTADTQITATAPMLSYVATAPLLAQTGVGYLKYIDSLLEQVESGVDELANSKIQMFTLASDAAKMKGNKYLNPREKAHLQALDCMLNHDHKRAMLVLVKHLEICPGDGLALSIVLDLAHTVGDPNAALRYILFSVYKGVF